MSLNSTTLGNMLREAVLDMPISSPYTAEDITVRGILVDNAVKKEISDYKELDAYKQIDKTWNTIAVQIVSHIKDTAEVELTKDMDALKQAIGSLIASPSDGGAAILQQLKASDWYTRTYSNKVI